MIQLNALDFNVCRSEEVISFFWRSVYIAMKEFLIFLHLLICLFL